MKQERLPLLIVEDDERFRDTLKLEFEERGYDVSTASTLESVRNLKLPALRFATVDLRLNSEFGLPIVQYLKSTFPDCRIIVLTGYGSIATAVDATKKGASQYMTKPVQIDQLERVLWTDAPADFENEEPTNASLARHEREYIEWVLVQSGNNITEAARRLGIHRQSLQRKLRKYTPLT